MATQIDVVNKVLSELGTGKLTLEDAVARAEALKPLKNKNKLKNWAGHFKKIGVVTKDETGTFVTAKVVAEPTPTPVPTPVVEPVAEAPKTE